MHAENHELTIDANFVLPGSSPSRYGPGSETDLRSIAERVHGGPLDWYKAYRGNLYAEDHGLSYAIRRLPPRAD